VSSHRFSIIHLGALCDELLGTRQPRLCYRVACPGARRTTRHLTSRQSSNSWCRPPVQVPWHDHQFAPDDLPSTFRSAPYPYRPKPIGQNLVQKTSGLGALRPSLDWPFAFSPWSPAGVTRPGRNPPRRSSHRMVVQSFECPNPHAVLRHHSESLSFRSPSPIYPHIQLVCR